MTSPPDAVPPGGPPGPSRSGVPGPPGAAATPPPPLPHPPTRRHGPLPRNVVALGAVSFLTDVASEMIYPLLPVFLTAVLGLDKAVVGLIEGAAETTASFVKLASGWWADRVAKRKSLVLAGYVLASFARPLVALAQSAGHVLAVRLTDRVGKGIRTAPRDALIADSVEPGSRGRAFGFHRSADHAGAVVGPLLASAMLAFGVAYRSIFWIAAIPGVLAVVTIAGFVREVPRPARDAKTAPAGAGPLGGRFWSFLAVVFVFTLGNSTDAFLVLRATSLGVPVAMVPVLWAALHVVKSLSSTPGGALSDRIGRRPLIVGGWLCYAGVYVGLGAATAAWHVWALVAAYGLFFGMTEGTEKALVADLVPAARRGTAFGWYNAAIGVAALPASLVFGLLWDGWGPGMAFTTGAALALVAAAGMTLLVGTPPPGEAQA